MNRLVYLFELDSVRNSKQEVEIGQKALFDEIVKNGNSVIMTFNQLTDSIAIMGLIDDDKSYASILELFKLGAIKVSQYGTTTTASRYLQSSIEKCLQELDKIITKITADLYQDQLGRNEFEDEMIFDEAAAEKKMENIFLFSGLPIRSTDRNLLMKIQSALRNSDPSILDRMVDSLAKNGDMDADRLKELQNMRLLSRFIRLVLAISVEKDVNNPPKTNSGKSFISFLHDIYEMPDNVILKWSIDLEDKEIAGQFPAALQLLRETELLVEKGSINNRSIWFKRISREAETNSTMAEMIVDLCYNFAVEDSIRGVSKHYLDSDDKTLFYHLFLCRFTEYWNLYKNKDHTIFALTKKMPDFKKSDLHWNQAVRIWTSPKWKLFSRSITSRVVNENTSQDNYIGLYEYNLSKEKSTWEKRNLIKLVLIITTAFFYILMFCCVSLFTGQTQEFVNQLWPHVYFSYMSIFFIQTIAVTFAFGVFGSLLSKLLKLPDVLDSIQSIGHGFVDVISTLKKPQTPTCLQKNSTQYARMSKADVLIPLEKEKSAEPQMNVPQPEMTPEWKAYQKLMLARPEQFEKSEFIDIVTDWRIVGRYEIVNHKKIGVLYDSPYNMLVVDLISNHKGGYYTYERIIPTVDRGAVVVFVTRGTQVVLLKQYRHALRDYEYSLPRGFGEMGLNAQENARKEVQEELNAEVLSTVFLGTTVADSGLSNSEVSVFWCTIEKFEVNPGYEGIADIALLEIEEFQDWIHSGRIKDGFTLTAYSLYRNLVRNDLAVDI